MKNLIYSKLILTLVISLFAFSSSFAQEKKKVEKVEVKSSTYICPMDCEKGKTYKTKGKCKKCKMYLVVNEPKKVPEAEPVKKREMNEEEKKHGHYH